MDLIVGNHRNNLILFSYQVIFLFLALYITRTSSYSRLMVSMKSDTPKYYKLNKVSFTSPILSSGYKPAVVEYNNHHISQKPILLYLPGFDGTLLSPFLQYPELSTVFDLRGMSVVMDDSFLSFDELKDTVKEYILDVLCSNENGEKRDIYLMGESFGGVLSCGVLEDEKVKEKVAGLILVNPATSFPRSNLMKAYEEIKKQPLSSIFYPFKLIQNVLPLFIDDFQLPQLLLILFSKALPSVIDTPSREAYMGRVAFTLPNKLKYMPRDVFLWRMEEWLIHGCNTINLDKIKDMNTLLIAGEDDKTLPSVEEIQKLSKLFIKNKMVIVPDAGHTSTCGSRIDLTAEIRNAFYEQIYDNDNNNPFDNKRRQMKDVPRSNTEEFYGMEPRYDGNTNIGLSPLRYWDDDLFMECKG